MLTLNDDQIFELRLGLQTVIEALTSKDSLDTNKLNKTLANMSHLLDIHIGYKPLSIERKSQALRELNKNLHRNSYELIKAHLEKQYDNF